MSYMKPCPKCGSNYLYTRYFRAGDKWNDGSAESETVIQEDCLHLYCRNCGYRWNSVPLDGQSSPEQQYPHTEYVGAQSFNVAVLMLGFLCGFWYDPSNKLYRASDETWWRREGLELVPTTPPEGWSKST